MIRHSVCAAVLLTFLGACQTVPTATEPVAATPTASAPSAVSGGSMGAALNAARTSNGRPAIQASPQLMAAARVQANFMASTGQLTHTGPGGSNVSQRVRAQGCGSGWVGENVAVGQSSDASTMDWWMNSAGHRRNALNSNARLYGHAQAGSYRVLVLAGGC